MATNEQDFVLFLLRKSLGLPAERPDCPSDVGTLERIIVKGSVLLTVYPAIRELVDADRAQGRCDPGLEKLEADLNMRYMLTAKQFVSQESEGEKVLNALSSSGLNCIGLKGWELKDLYPKSGMRQMSDLDILVRPYDFPKIEEVMTGLGYGSGGEDSWMHDNFTKGDVCVEMHKRLTDDSSRIRDWENEMWDRAIRVKENRFQMAPEDYLIYHIVHLHKDFLNGSLGLRRIVDTRILDSRVEFDRDFTERTLEEFGMLPFYRSMILLSRAVMGVSPIGEDQQILLDHAFRCGIYGTMKSYKTGRIVAMGPNLRVGKFRSAVSAVFLPYSRMKAHYPKLEKAPVLLPFYWIKRIFGFLKTGAKNGKERLDYSEIGSEEFESMKRVFEAGGVR